MHSGQRGVDNLAKPLKENIIEGLMVLVKNYDEKQFQFVNYIDQWYSKKLKKSEFSYNSLYQYPVRMT